MKKNQTDKAARTSAAILTEIGTAKEALARSEAAVQAARQDEADAQAHADKLGVKAVAFDDAGAQAEIDKRTDDVVRASRRRRTAEKSVEQMRAEIARLNIELGAAKMVEARVRNAEDDAIRIEAAKEMDAAVATMRAAWSRHREAIIRQVERSVDADLPDREVGLLQRTLHIERLVMWGLRPITNRYADVPPDWRATTIEAEERNRAAGVLNMPTPEVPERATAIPDLSQYGDDMLAVVPAQSH